MSDEVLEARRELGEAQRVLHELSDRLVTVAVLLNKFNAGVETNEGAVL